ncbi:MAG: site-2 protease family protein [Phycisphaerae bacterium]|nr:site-2 protease family protein [Phycisphaerae bacterium]
MSYLYLLPGLIIGLTVHEAAHALSAKWLGDDVAWRQGRVTLNPLKHLSLFGTLALFVLHFGWGKPVEVNLYHFKSPKRDYLISSLAGPLSNILLSGLALSLLHLSWPDWFTAFLMSLFMINAILALVNLIPIPPLDGSKIWPCIIPGMRPVIKNRMSQVWLVVLLVAMYTGGIGKILTPSMNFLKGIVYTVMDDTETYTERPDDFPDSLVAPDNAVNTIYKISPAKKNRADGYGLYYTLEQPYPCDSLISSITESLAEQGWHKTVYVLFDPNELSSDQWATLQDEKGQFIEWTGTWINEFSEWVYLNVYYEVESETLIPATAHISMYQNTDKMVILYRALHPNEMPVIRDP